jgi:hypothetical protein
MKRLAFIFILGLVVSAFALAAQAEDFTFNIPVELHSIPADIKTFAVSVAVYDRAPDSRGYRPDESRIGYGGSPTISLVNGEYVGTVTVKFNAQPRREPEKAMLYEAHLLLQGPPGYQGGVLNAMGLDTPYPYDPEKPLVYFLTGPIQQSTPMKHIEPMKIPRRFPY